MIEGDSLDDIKLTREAGEAVGWYTITFDKLSTNGNYNITYRDGMFFSSPSRIRSGSDMPYAPQVLLHEPP